MISPQNLCDWVSCCEAIRKYKILCDSWQNCENWQVCIVTKLTELIHLILDVFVGSCSPVISKVKAMSYSIFRYVAVHCWLQLWGTTSLKK